jgi:hypothetical protein
MPQGIQSNPQIYLITRINHWASSDSGDAIQLVVTIQDETQIVLRSAYKDVSRLVQATLQAAMIAEQKQQAIPDQNIQTMSPWMVTNVDSGLSTDGKYVGLIYQTTEGVPVEVTMSPDVARETIECLSSELDNLDQGQYPKLS